MRASLSASVERWKQEPALAGWRWADGAAWHVTLAFVGPVPPADVASLAERVTDAVHSRTPFVVESARPGAFPSPRRASVLWAGVADSGEEMVSLATAARQAVGVEDARPARPHITVARGAVRGSDLRGFLATADPPSGSMTVDQVAILRSHLGSGPARYETLARIELRGAADG